MIYLLHSTVPLGGKGRASAQHYIGMCMDGTLENRLGQHLSGRSNVAIIRAFLERGATLILARTWADGGSVLERYLKKQGHFRDLCPICRQASGRPLKLTPGTLPTVSLPLYVSHLRRRPRTSGGVSSPGSPTSSTGGSRPEHVQGSFTKSLGLPDVAEPAGGTPSPVTAPQRPPADASAGTRLRSSSASTTRARSTQGRNPDELAQ